MCISFPQAPPPPPPYPWNPRSPPPTPTWTAWVRRSSAASSCLNGRSSAGWGGLSPPRGPALPTPPLQLPRLQGGSRDRLGHCYLVSVTTEQLRGMYVFLALTGRLLCSFCEWKSWDQFSEKAYGYNSCIIQNIICSVFKCFQLYTPLIGSPTY